MVYTLGMVAADLGRASAEVAGRAGVAMQKVAADIEAEAKTRAPVDTGFLRGSISSSFTAAGGSFTVEIGPTAEYGGYVELGTSRQAPQPYLQPAFDRHAPLLEAALARLAVP